MLPIGTRTYKLSVLTKTRQGALEEWVAGQVVAAATRQKAQFEREDFIALLASINRDIANRMYSFNKPACQQMLRETFEGAT